MESTFSYLDEKAGGHRSDLKNRQQCRARQMQPPGNPYHNAL